MRLTGGRALPCKSQMVGEAALGADLITAFRPFLTTVLTNYSRFCMVLLALLHVQASL